MKTLFDYIKSEPAAFAALARAVLIGAATFGLKLTPEQITAVYVVVECVLTIITRQNVTPVIKQPAPPEFKP